MKTRILVVDDHFTIRSGLSACVNVEPDLEVVAEAADGDEAMRLYRECQPDLVIMDTQLPGPSGSQTTKCLIAEFSSAKVLMLSSYGGEEDVFQALQAGAKGYLLKRAVRAELLTAIREVAAGRRYLDSFVAQSLAQRVTHPALTARELEVLEMLVRGLTNKEIASSLRVSEVTIKQHVSHTFQKMAVSDRTQAATAALQRGFVHLEELALV